MHSWLTAQMKPVTQAASAAGAEIGSLVHGVLLAASISDTGSTGASRGPFSTGERIPLAEIGT